MNDLKKSIQGHKISLESLASVLEVITGRGGISELMKSDLEYVRTVVSAMVTSIESIEKEINEPKE